MGRKMWLSRLVLAASILMLACTFRENANENDAQAADQAVNIPQADCGVGRSSGLNGAGIGDVRVGTPVEQLRARCRVVRDTTLQFGNEGMPERRIAVALGADSIEATIVNDRVWRIEVRTPRFRTADSLGVGSLARDIKRGPTTLATGDRGVFALRRDHCGLSFQLTGIAPERGRTWAMIPDTTPIGLVLIFGCSESA